MLATNRAQQTQTSETILLRRRTTFSLLHDFLLSDLQLI
jgi:hypothetical protein